MTIKLDVLIIQLIHVAILFRLFKKIIGDSLTQAIIKRKSLMAKLEDADKTYAEIIAEANEKSDALVQEWMEHKNKIIAEGKMLAEQKADAIVEKAQQEAKDLVAKIKADESKMKQELEENFATGVKRTTEIVVKKLLKGDHQLQQEYMDQLVKEATK